MLVVFVALALTPAISSTGMDAIVSGVNPEHPLVPQIGELIRGAQISDEIAIFNMCNQPERARGIISDLVDGQLISGVVFSYDMYYWNDKWSAFRYNFMMIFIESQVRSWRKSGNIAPRITYIPFWNQKMKIFVIYLSDDPLDVQLEKSKDILRTLSFFKIFQVAIVLFSNKQIFLHTHNPFGNDFDLFEGPSVSLSKIFPIKTRNLMGHKLVIGEMNIYPQESIVNGRLLGLIGLVLDIVMDYLNATYKIKEVNMTDQPLMTLGRMVMYHQVDFNFNLQFLFPTIMKMPWFSWTTPLSVHKMCCLVPYQRNDTSIIRIIMQLTRSSLLLYDAFMVLMAVCWSRTRRPRISFTESIWHMERVLLLSTIPRRFPTPVERIFVGAAIVASFFFMGSLQPFLVAEMVQPHEAHQIDTLEELKTLDKPILLQPGMAPIIIRTLDSNLPHSIVQRLWVILKIIHGETTLNPWVMRRDKIRHEIVYAVDVFKISNFVDSMANREADGAPTFHLMKECLVHSPAGFPFPRNSPYLDQFNNILRRSFEAGLFKRLLTLERHKLRVKHMVVNPEELHGIERKNLVTFEHIGKALPIMMEAWLFTGIVLLLENLYARRVLIWAFLLRRRTGN